MKKYPKYKPSGVEWIGDIPDHWKVQKIKHCCKTDTNQITQDKLNGVELIHYSIPNVQEYGTGIIENGSDIDSSKLIVKGGEILFSKLNPRKGTICIVKENQELLSVCSGEFISLIPKNDDTKFTFYQIGSKPLIDFVNSQVESVTKSHQRIRPDNYLNSFILSPPLSEQLKIVSFLDERTELIDKLISTKERKVELLNEQRISLINEVITKGLSPGVNMKDSGVKWIGEIPFHWEVRLIKYVFKPVRERSETGNEELLSVLIRKGVVKRRDFLEDDSDHLSRSETLVGYIKCSKGNLVNNIMKMGFYCLGISEYDGIVSPAYSVFELIDKRYNTRYWEYLLKTELYVGEYRKRSKGIQESRMRLYDDYFLSIHSIVPPIDEQFKIVEFIDQRTKELDDLISIEQKKIDLLNQYRQSLISEVITGKFDVRQNLN